MRPQHPTQLTLVFGDASNSCPLNLERLGGLRAHLVSLQKPCKSLALVHLPAHLSTRVFPSNKSERKRHILGIIENKPIGPHFSCR